MEQTRYFAGGNTAEGFFSCFMDILPEAERKRMFFIKGGPGVGKSSLMRKIGAAFEEKGETVEYFHCSSDPDSLDGISVPALGLAMMDGTAPHVYDPEIPAARDSLINLGDFLDEGALRNQMGEIRRLQGELSGRFARCYAYLGGAAKVRAAAARGLEDAQKMTNLCTELTEKYLPLRGGRGKRRTLFSAAFTPKGYVNLLPTLPRETTVTVEVPFGHTADGLLSALLERCLSRGLNAIALRDPLEPRLLAHVAVPAHSLLFTTDPLPQATQAIPAEALMNLREATEKEQSFDRNAYELLIQRAGEQLKGAKALHDELESYYVANMDFLRWGKLFDQVKEQLGF